MPTKPSEHALHQYARDWATICQSEWAAIAADGEIGLALQQICAAWLDVATFADDRRGAVHHAERPAAGADAPPGTAAAAAAAGARDAELESLRRRLDELEQHLARLDDAKPAGA